MNESDTRAHYIDPALYAKGWRVKATPEEGRMRTEFFITKGPLLGNGVVGKALKADYVLQYRNRNLGIIEAKADTQHFTEGVAQAKDYAMRLKVRFTYSTNGKQIYCMDMLAGRESEVAQYPTPEELWAMTFDLSGIDAPTAAPEEEEEELMSPEMMASITSSSGINWHERLMGIPFEDRGGTWQPRYYQDNAITKTLDAVASGEDRILLTLATGTGKTAIAFQIAWKLYHARWNLNRDGARLPRILFLADRNILADQAFKAFILSFEETALKRITPHEIKKTGKVPTNGSIFFTIFQTFMSGGSTNSPTAVESENRSLSLSKGRLEDGSDVTFDELKEINSAYGYMYILQCADGSFYIGSTKDLGRRLAEHNSGEAANYTRKHSPVRLVYYEGFSRIDEAFNREKQVQKWSRAKKIALIKGDTELLVELSRNRQSSTPSTSSGAGLLTGNESSSVGELVEPENDFDPEVVGERAEPYFGAYPPDFFDFIIIDECHRAGATDASSWRSIMDYFSPAVQLGLTATPKRDVNGDTYAYFGKPVYEYSLKEGINDGFLTPFRYKEVSTTGDQYRFSQGDTIMAGEIDENRVYGQEEQNRVIEIMDVEQYRVKVLLQSINQNHKTIVFCADQVHALAVCNLINQLSTSSNLNYCQRVTANDGKLGEQHLGQFQDNQRSIPTILTTSQKLSTGVDAPEVRNVVLMRVVRSMVEFKQIIGRGTRLSDGKDYFTVYDFYWRLHTHFEDPEWDGPALPPEEPTERPISDPCLRCGQRRCICDREEPERCELCGKWPCECNGEPPREKIKVKLADGTARSLQHMTRTRFWSKEGKPISADAFVQQLFGELPSLFENEQQLREIWSLPHTRKKLLEALEEKGYSQAQLSDLQELVEGKDSDLFDVLSFVAYHRTLVPRSTRADSAKVHFDTYDPKQQEFLNFVLEQYVKSGVEELDDDKLGDLLKLKYNAVADAKAQLGSIASIRENFIGFQKWLYGEVG